MITDVILRYSIVLKLFAFFFVV